MALDRFPDRRRRVGDRPAAATTITASTSPSIADDTGNARGVISTVEFGR